MSTVAAKKVKLGDHADPSKNFLIEVPAAITVRGLPDDAE